MDNTNIPRDNAALAAVVRAGLEWGRTYGQRSAAAYLVYRNVPRAIIERIFQAACRHDDHPGPR